MIELDLPVRAKHCDDYPPDAHLLATDVLPLLGMSGDHDVLTSSITCPFCDHKQLRIYPLNDGGFWHHCSSCKQQGDLIELASKVWELSLEATLLKLFNRGLLTDAKWLGVDAQESYVNTYVQRRQSAALFLKAAAERAYDGQNPVANTLRGKLGFAWEYRTPESWNKSLGPLMGTVSARDLELFYSRDEVKKKDKKVKLSELFRGQRRWQDSIILPYYRAPGCISAFLFVGRDGKKALGDYQFKPIFQGRRASLLDAGLWGITTAWDCGSGWYDFVLAIDDPILALKLQHRNFSQSRTPLPIVCWHDDGRERTADSWQALSGKRIIFWANRPSARLLRQVKLAKGSLVLRSIPDFKSQYWKDYLPREILMKLADRAKDPDIAVAEWMRRVSDARIEELALTCERANVSLASVAKAADRQTASRLENLIGQSISLRPTVRLPLKGRNPISIVEQDSQWMHLKTCGDTARPVPLCNCILRVDQVISRGKASSALYAGRVIYKDKTYEFQIRVNYLLKFPWRWLNEFLIRKAGVTLVADNRIKNALLQIATAFQEPSPVRSTSRVGWRQANRQFRLPNLVIGQSGQAVPLITSRHTPGRKFREIEQPDFSAMRNSPSTQTFWATLALGLANILAPAFNQEQTGIGLLGAGAATIGDIVARHVLDIPEFHPRRGRAGGVRLLQSLQQRHHWPAYVTMPLDSRFTLQWFRLPTQPRNCLAVVSDRVARFLPILTPWRFVVADATLRSMSWMGPDAEKIVPAYLQHVCENFDSIVPDGHWANVILRDLAAWVGDREGEPAHVLAATNCWRLDSRMSAGKAILDLLAWTMVENCLAERHIEFMKGKRRGVFIVDDSKRQGLFIPRDSMASVFHRAGAGTVATQLVTQAFRDADYLLDEKAEWDSRVGWLIKLDIWRSNGKNK